MSSPIKRPPLRLEPVPKTVDQSLIDHVLAMTARLNAIDDDVVETRAQALLTAASVSRLEQRLFPAPGQPTKEPSLHDIAASIREPLEDLVEEITSRHNVVPLQPPPINSEHVRAIVAEDRKGRRLAFYDLTTKNVLGWVKNAIGVGALYCAARLGEYLLRGHW